MKKLITLLLLPLFASGQIDRYVSATISIDVMNIIKGSQPTNYKPEFDLSANASIHLGNGLTWNFQFETFKAIGYSELSCGAGYVIEPLPKVRVHFDLMTELIFRRGEMVEQHFQYNDQFIGASTNIKLGYEVLPNVYVGGIGGVQYAGDLVDAGYSKKFRFNGGVCVEYVLYIDL
jgi:hypothetical protein